MRTLTTRRLAITLCALSGGLLDCQCDANDLGQDPARTEVVRGGDPSTTSSAPLFPIRYGARIGDTVADEGFVGEDGTIFVTFNRHGAVDSRRYETYSETEEGTFLHASTPEGLLSRPRLIAPNEARVGMTWRADTSGDGEFEFELEVLSKDEDQPTPWGDATVWRIVERNLTTGFESERRFVEGRGLWPTYTRETVTPLDRITPPTPPDPRQLTLERLRVPTRAEPGGEIESDSDEEFVLVDSLKNGVITEMSVIDSGSGRVLLLDYDGYDPEADIRRVGIRRCLLLGEDGALSEPDEGARARLCPGEPLHAGEVMFASSGEFADWRVSGPDERSYGFTVPFFDAQGDATNLSGDPIEFTIYEMGEDSRRHSRAQGDQDWTARTHYVSRAITLESTPDEGAYFGALGRGNDLYTARLSPPGGPWGAPRLGYASPRGVVMGTLSVSTTHTPDSMRTRLTSSLRDGRIVSIDPETGTHTLLGRARTPDGHTRLMAARLSQDQIIVSTFERSSTNTHIWLASVDAGESDLERHPIFSARSYGSSHGAVICWKGTGEAPDTSGWKIDGREPMFALINARGDCAYVGASDLRSRHVVADIPGAGRARLTPSSERTFSHDELLTLFEFEHFRRHDIGATSPIRSAEGIVSLEALAHESGAGGRTWFRARQPSPGSPVGLATGALASRPERVGDFTAKAVNEVRPVSPTGLLVKAYDTPNTYDLLHLDGGAPPHTKWIHHRDIDEDDRVFIEDGLRCQWRSTAFSCSGGEGGDWAIEGTELLTPPYYQTNTTHTISPGVFLIIELGQAFVFDLTTREGRTLTTPEELVMALCTTRGGRALAAVDGKLTWLYPERVSARIEGVAETLVGVEFCQELSPGVFWLEESFSSDTIVRLVGTP